jgi:hypothetical protein
MIRPFDPLHGWLLADSVRQVDTFAVRYSNGQSDSANSLEEARQKISEATKIDQARALLPAHIYRLSDRRDIGSAQLVETHN